MPTQDQIALMHAIRTKVRIDNEKVLERYGENPVATPQRPITTKQETPDEDWP